MDQSIYGFPSCLSHEAFPRGFPTGLSHVHTWWDSILSLNVKAVQGKQVPLECTDPEITWAPRPFIYAADCVTLLLELWRKAQVYARIRDED